MNYKFSIVIPCYNEEEYILPCIDSIHNQDYDPSLIEIVISDGFSTDCTRQLIKEYQKKYSNIKLVDNPVRKTPQALNIGIKNSSGDVIIILGAHTRLDKEFVKFNNKYLNENNNKVTGGTQQNIGKTFFQSLIGIVMEMPFAMASASYRWSKTEQYVDTVVYAAYKRELFDEVGYFEENFTISEDAEFNWRIRQAGYKIFFSPKIKSYYYPRNSIKRFVKQIFRYGILRVNVLKKHKDSIKLLHLIPPLFTVSILTLLIIAISIPVLSVLFWYFMSLYFIINIVAAIIKLFPRKILFLPMVSLLVFTMHFSWGLGFVIGWVLPKSDKW